MQNKGLILATLFLAAAGSCGLAAQEAEVGVAVPVTITAGALETGRAQAGEPTTASFTVGFRALAVPELKLGTHWYIYSAVQVRSTPFFYDDAYDADRRIKADFLQGFVGYSRAWGKTALNLKFGKQPAAFGAFPLRYDDAANALLDQPLPYNYLGVQPGQLPCRIADFNSWPSWGFFCGNAWNTGYGIMPVTLYGLPSAEADLSWHRLDARFQLTNSSPANPHGLFQSGQHAQLTAGAGYTIRQGFRIGASAFRGPWLDNAVQRDLPQHTSVADFPMTAVGVDAQWAQGGWSASGEWQRFVFRYPALSVSPASSFGYVELKRIINARWYAAFRGNYEANNHPQDATARSTTSFLPNVQEYELAVGFRPNRFQLLKVGYELVSINGSPRPKDNVLGLQLVTSINSLSKAFK